MNSHGAIFSGARVLAMLACAVLAHVDAAAVARLGPFNVTRSAGTVLEIPLGFTSTEAVTCVQFDLLFDPTRVTPGTVATSVGAAGHQIASREISAGRCRVVLFSTSLEPLLGGYIVTIPLTWLADGDSALALDAVALASPDPAEVAFAGSALTPAVASSAGGSGPTGGSAATMSVEETYGSGVTYQWRFNGADITGATSPSLTFGSAQAFHAGTYTVVVTANGMVFTSQSFDLTVNPPVANDARLLNLSTRAVCLTGDDVLIPGFYVSGSGAKRLLMRAVGPELARFGVAGPLADPQIVLKRQGDNAIIATNEDWGDNANWEDIRDTARALFAFGLTEGSKSAALLLDLPAGGYTIVASGHGDETGVSIVELYDVSGSTDTARLINISNRGYVGVGGQIMIPGFVVSEEGSRTFLIRAVGPSLTRFGVGGVLADPKIEVYKRRPGTAIDDLILTNDAWGENGDAEQIRQAATSVSAFRLNDGSADAAFVVTLPPGAFTVNAKGVGDTTGVALVEVYLVP